MLPYLMRNFSKNLPKEPGMGTSCLFVTCLHSLAQRDSRHFCYHTLNGQFNKNPTFIAILTFLDSSHRRHMSMAQSFASSFHSFTREAQYLLVPYTLRIVGKHFSIARSRSFRQVKSRTI